MHRRPRRLAGVLLTLAAVLAAAGCSGDTTEPAAAAEGGGWRFTDDLGTTVELDATPARVAGLNDVVASLWNYGVEPDAVPEVVAEAPAALLRRGGRLRGLAGAACGRDQRSQDEGGAGQAAGSAVQRISSGSGRRCSSGREAQVSLA